MWMYRALVQVEYQVERQVEEENSGAVYSVDMEIIFIVQKTKSNDGKVQTASIWAHPFVFLWFNLY